MAEQEHRIIFLEPRCAAESGEDRHWCQDDAWGNCDECGTKSVKYIIASEHEALAKALKKLSLAYVNLLEIGRDRIIALGGTCDAVDVMEAGDPVLREIREVLSGADVGGEKL